MRQLLLTLALALSAAPAFAQGTEAEPQAAPGSIAIGMIEQADAIGIFDIVHNGQVSVRHLRSGLRCDFDREGHGRLIVFAPPPSASTPPGEAPAIPRGDDVACDMTEGAAQVRYFATRYPFGSTLEEQIAGVETAIQRREASAVRYPGATVRGIEDGLPLRRTTRFIVVRDGVRLFTSASVARIGDWILKLRYTAPAPDDATAAQADANAALAFDSSLRQIIDEPN
ncbi:MAG: hypothetical protein R3C30_03050 [Hyphomonadaceae bacterium]